MKLLLDGNRYTDFIAGDPTVREQFRLATVIAFPTIVLGELRAGFFKGTRTAKNEQTLLDFLAGARVTVINVDEETSHVYAMLMDHLRRLGTPIPINDVWIAALSLQHGLTLYTRDAHFARLPQLQRI